MSVHDLQLLNQASFAGTWDIITSIKLVPAPQPWKYFDPLIIRRKRLGHLPERSAAETYHPLRHVLRSLEQRAVAEVEF